MGVAVFHVVLNDSQKQNQENRENIVVHFACIFTLLCNANWSMFAKSFFLYRIMLRIICNCSE